jgi:hypothetical protein
MGSIDHEREPDRDCLHDTSSVSRSSVAPLPGAFCDHGSDMTRKRRSMPAFPTQNDDLQKPEDMDTARKRRSEGYPLDMPGKRRRHWQDTDAELDWQSTVNTTADATDIALDGEPGNTEVAPFFENTPWLNDVNKESCYDGDELQLSLQSITNQDTRDNMRTTKAIRDDPPTPVEWPELCFTRPLTLPEMCLPDSPLAAQSLLSVPTGSETSNSPHNIKEGDMAVRDQSPELETRKTFAARFRKTDDVLPKIIEKAKVNLAKLRGQHWECATCGTYASSVKAMEQHAAWDKLKGCQSFKCKETGCQFRSAKYDNYHRHIKTSHKSKKDFECEFCNRKGIRGFNRKNDLDTHMKAWHPQEWDRLQKEYPKFCTESGCMHAQTRREFKTEAKYLSHMRKEHGHGKLDCTAPGCHRKGKNGYTRQSDLVLHRARDHP